MVSNLLTTINFQTSWQDLLCCKLSRSQTFSNKNDRHFNKYKIPNENFFYYRFNKVLSKILWTKFRFFNTYLRFFFRDSILSTFTICNVLLLKWRPSQYTIKIGKKTLVECYFHKSFVKNIKKKPLFFNSYFQIPFQEVMLCRVLKSQNFID